MPMELEWTIELGKIFLILGEKEYMNLTIGQT